MRRLYRVQEVYIMLSSPIPLLSLSKAISSFFLVPSPDFSFRSVVTFPLPFFFLSLLLLARERYSFFIFTERTCGEYLGKAKSNMDSRRWRQIPENQSHPYHQPYLEVREQGLEVGEDPYRSPHTGWPDATKPVWGIQSVEPRMEIRPDERVLYPHPVDMKGAGLDVGLAWKHDSEVLLPRRESGRAL